MMNLSDRTAPRRHEDDPRWGAVITRDTRADGRFFYGVRTTGVYCRPSCAARTARPENVTFYASAAEAEQAGLRPCKRCRPHEESNTQRQTAQIAALCRLIEQAPAPLSLNALARHAGLSPFHLQRRFKTVTGVTPREYAEAVRTRRLHATLPVASSVTDAMLDAGFESGGRFYATADARLGMTPQRFREGGKDADIRYAIRASTLGQLLVARSTRGVCAILIGHDAEALADALRQRFPRAARVAKDAGLAQLLDAVVALVEMPEQPHSLPLDIRGTAFQQRVWQELRKIPAGATASYTQIAQRLGMPRATRAVAQACAANMLAVAIPCHRVVRSDGALSGYRWGVERKRALLERESGARVKARVR